MSQRHSVVVLLALVALTLPAGAQAATPASGAVSPTQKSTAWSGTITDPIGAYDLVMFFNGGTSVRGNETCASVVCDTYMLDVADGARELRVVADAPDSDNVSMDVTTPDGERLNLNTATLYTQRTLIWTAIPGTWTIHVYGTGRVDQFDYTATAEVNLPGEPAFVPPDDGSDAFG